MDTDSTTPKQDCQAVPAKKHYEKPALVSHGTVGELTQSGGNLHRDGVFTRKLS